MNLDKIKAKRLTALENAYEQLIIALSEELDPSEVDPEKRKAAMALYKQAAEDSDYILRLIIALKEEQGEEIVKQKKVERKEFNGSPESRIKK